MNGSTFGSVIWIAFGISAFATLFLALIVRVFFRRSKPVTEP